MTDCIQITSDVSFQQEGLVEITFFFFLWKLNAIISIKPIQNTEGVDRMDRRVEGGGEIVAAQEARTHLGAAQLSHCWD